MSKRNHKRAIRRWLRQTLRNYRIDAPTIAGRRWLIEQDWDYRFARWRRKGLL